jgi:DNA-binding Lrp family transcriptional regulator
MLDEKSVEILKELQRDSKQTIKKMAKKLDMRPSTVYDRIQMLEKDGVIEKYVALLSDEKLEIEIVGFILIRGRTTRYLDKMPTLYTDPHVAEIRGVTGDFDMLIKTRFKSMREFSKFLINLREHLGEDIFETKTLISTVKLKETTERPIDLHMK